MNATQTTSDPVLQRLHEVTDRIRRRAAESRARAELRARGLDRPRRPPAASRSGQAELPLEERRPPLRLESPPTPPDWSRAA